MRAQVRQRQQTNIGLLLDTRGLGIVLKQKKRRTQITTESDVELHFVGVLQQTVSKWNIDLWLEGGQLRGEIPVFAAKNKVEAALLLRIREEV